MTDVFTGLILDQDDTRNGVNKISYVLPPDGDGFFASLQANFPDLYHGTWGGHEGKKLFGDVRPAGITKAHAIHTLLGYLADTNEPAPPPLHLEMLCLTYPCLKPAMCPSPWATQLMR